MNPLRQSLASLIRQAVERGTGASIDEQAIDEAWDIPKDGKFGDLSSHVALRLSKSLKKAPRQVAESVEKPLRELLKASDAAASVTNISIEGPGFINFYFSALETARVLSRIHREGPAYGKPPLIKVKNILLEYVSANPTGPLTVAHGRQAALGDSLARILRFCGHKVTTEYYNNDEGVQINILGESTYARLMGREIPENGYKGDYLIETAARLKQSGIQLSQDPAQDAKRCSEFAKNDIMRGIRQDLEDFGVRFDNYYSQEALAKSGKVEKTLDLLKAKGVTFESEGAFWFRSTEFGDDKDRVLIKSDKSYTYLTPDIAYHHDKFSRGFEEMIDIWGPDHHGYIARLKASQAALGHDPDSVRILIAQLVTLYEGDKQVRMSTRAGEFVTLREIIDEVGRDAGRFFFLMRKFDAHLDFDLQLAKTQTSDNPVFYIQYAHARIESIKRQNEALLQALPWSDEAVLGLLTGNAEQRLLRLLGQYTDTVRAAERTLEPYRIVPYLSEAAAAFHRFYTDHRIVSDDPRLTGARLMLCLCTQSVIRQGLDLLGVHAPEKM